MGDTFIHLNDYTMLCDTAKDNMCGTADRLTFIWKWTKLKKQKYIK